MRNLGVQLQAMVFLGVNCALGNSDCALLPISALDLKRGWLEFPRPKTTVERRAPLWPETINAIKAALKARREPKDTKHADRVFITQRGDVWGPKEIADNPISKEFAKVLKRLEIHRKGVGFYALRHVFRTIGQRTRDKDAVEQIMGHAPDEGDVGEVYYSEERPDDARLKAVSNYVRAWLFSAKKRAR